MALQWQPETSIRGPQGQQGATGAKGDRGDTGATGAPGSKGDKGDPTFVTTQAGLATALAAGGDVYCDSAVTIALTSTQNITKPTRLIGGRFTRTTGEAFRITSSNVELDGVTITGGGTPYDQSQKLIRAIGSSSSRLTGISIHDCTLRNSRADNIWLEWCDGAVVSRNTIRSFLYSGVEIISGANVRVTDNDVSDGRLTSSQVYGIAFSDVDNTAAARSYDCIALGNRVHLIDWEGIDTHGGDSISVVGNIITACVRGVALIGGNTSRLMVAQRCVVSGNRIDGSGARQALREGIILGGLAGKPADATITGNLIDNYGTPFLLDLWDRNQTFVGGNNPPLVPWTNLPLTGQVVASSTEPPQYMIDGNTVHLRGGVRRTSSGRTEHIVVGTVPAAGWPTQFTWISTVKAANPGGGTASWVALTNGQIGLYDGNGLVADVVWPLTGTYRVP